MFSFVVLLALVSTSMAAPHWRQTLGKALAPVAEARAESHAKRAACTMQQASAIGTFGQTLSTCATAANSSIPALCTCYGNYINSLKNVQCDGIQGAIDAINMACDSMMCSTCGTSGTGGLPACTTPQLDLLVRC
eukprot:TRINITY_DN104_c0_g1_i5.p2 TRINITY_DN104_c0_g1~~TRINITY_DN104_c0_g1_i5.p2  ORF type:complete len:135 (-),score=34.46 TRINITY_DN104_c0_g1_i5:86-490(-)